MNLTNLLNTLFAKTGYPDSGNNRFNYLIQDYMDACNTALAEICATCSPMLWTLKREGYVSIDPSNNGDGQATSVIYPTTAPANGFNGEYYLDDWCQRPLEFWTEGQYAHAVKCRRPRNVNLEGLRSTAFVPVTLGPWTIAPAPRSVYGKYNFGSGSSTGLTAAEGALTVVSEASASQFGSGNVGQMLRIGGEGGDYKITSVTGTSHTATIDRPIRSTMYGSMGVNGVGSGYTDARFETSPPGRYRIRLIPKPAETGTLYYHYMALPRKLLNNSDTPEIQEEYHHLIWKGALRIIMAEKDPEKYQVWASEFVNAVEMFKKSDADDVASDDAPPYETMTSDLQMNSVVLPGTNYRDVAGGYYG